ncbi:MAG: carboxypeptidase-like regulatory domain-containing protein [Candidatus Aenigmarchaeota archaeon]|nr:carboxypeptidase-like regulatory domain-containing protein [Candidatus Aenigmarchaeota archaeon]
MKKYILIVLLLIPISMSSPVISNITITPDNVWIDDTIEISFNCFEENYTIDSVKASITSPVMVPNINIVYDGAYKISLPMKYPYIGNYNLRIECQSNNPYENITLTDYTFTVYNLSANIESVLPEKIYSGDQVRVFLKLKRNNQNLDGTNQIDFEAYLNNTKVNFTSPIYYDPTKGWVLTFSPGEGRQNLKINYKVFGKTFYLEREINVNSNYYFGIISIDKSDVIPGDTINIRMFGSEKDSSIDSSQVSINYFIGTTAVLPENVSFSHTSSGTNIDTRIKLPDMSRGEYDLKMTITYKNNTFNFNRKINYQFEILGKIANSNGDFFNAKLKFKSGGNEKIFSTNSSGYFYGTLNKGKYDIEIEIKDYPNYPGIRLVLNQTELKSFQDAIRFDVLNNPNIEGIGVAAAYMIETNLDFSKAYLELVYDKRKISSLEDIVVYKCESWDYKENKCSDTMNEIDFDTSTGRSSVNIQVNDLSYFIVGYNKKLGVRFSTDKASYYIKEPIKITGYVEDQDGVAVKDANLELVILSTGTKYNAKTDKNGVFYMEFLSPEREGNFTFEIRASKDLFIDENKRSTFNVEKSRKISILMEDSFKVFKGDNFTIPIKLINVGQADLNVKIKIFGINENEYLIDMPLEFKINSNEEKNLNLKIFSNENSTSNIIGRFRVDYDGLFEEKQFILILDEKPKQSSEKNLKMPSAKIVIPEFNDISFTIVVSLLIILAAFVLKKAKNTKQSNTLILNDIKSEINK